METDFVIFCIAHNLGNPSDTAKTESFFRPFKMEEVYLKEGKSKASAKVDLQIFTEQVYNTQRLHSHLGSLPRGSRLRQALLRRER